MPPFPRHPLEDLGYSYNPEDPYSLDQLGTRRLLEGGAPPPPPIPQAPPLTDEYGNWLTTDPNEQKGIAGSYLNEFTRHPAIAAPTAIVESTGKAANLLYGAGRAAVTESGIFDPTSLYSQNRQVDPVAADPLQYWKLTPEGQKATLGEDVLGAFGLGPPSAQAGGYGQDIVEGVTGQDYADLLAQTKDPTLANYLLRPILATAPTLIEMVGDPGVALGMGIAGKGIAAERALARGIAGEAAGLGAMAGREGLEATVASARKFAQTAAAPYAISDIPDVIESGQALAESYQRTGFSPETAGAAAMFGVAGADAGLTPSGAVRGARAAYDLITNPQTNLPKAETPQEAQLRDGLIQLVKDGTISPDQARDAHAASQGFVFKTESGALLEEPNVPEAAASMEPEVQAANLQARQLLEPPPSSTEDEAAAEGMMEPPRRADDGRGSFPTPGPGVFVLPIQDTNEARAAMGFPPHNLQQRQAQRGTAEGPRQPPTELVPAPQVTHDPVELEASVDAAKRSLQQQYGWTEEELNDFQDPYTILALADEGMRPQDVEAFAADVRPGPIMASPFPQRGVTTDKLSPTSRDEIAKVVRGIDRGKTPADLDAPDLAEKMLTDAGVELYQEGQLADIGGGAFHNVFSAGRATKGKLAGKEVVLRVGSKRKGGGGPIYGDLPEFLGVGATQETKGGTVIDLVERTHSPEELGIPLATSFQHRFQAAKSLKKKTPLSSKVEDLMVNEGNLRYVEDPKGKVKVQGRTFRPVVSDFGVANPMNNIRRADRPTFEKGKFTIGIKVTRPDGSTKYEFETGANPSIALEKVKQQHPRGSTVERVPLAEAEAGAPSARPTAQKIPALNERTFGPAHDEFARDIYGTRPHGRPQGRPTMAKAESVEDEAAREDRIRGLEPPKRADVVHARTIQDPKLAAIQFDLLRALKSPDPNVKFETTRTLLAKAGYKLEKMGGEYQLRHPSVQGTVDFGQSLDHLIRRLTGREELIPFKSDPGATVKDFASQKGAKTFKGLKRSPWPMDAAHPRGRDQFTDAEAAALDAAMKKYGITPNIQFLGNGAFNQVFYLGKDSKGVEYVLRSNHTQFIGTSDYKGNKITLQYWKDMIPQSRHFARLVDSIEVDKFPFDITERVYLPNELGVKDRADFEVMAAIHQLKRAVKGSLGLGAIDLHSGNIGFVRDPKGTIISNKGIPHRPVVADLGAVNKAGFVPRADKVKLSNYLEGDTDFVYEIKESLDNPPNPEVAAAEAQQISKEADIHEVPITDRAAWSEMIDAMIAVRDKLRKKLGANPVFKSRDELLKKGITSFQGRTLTVSDPKKLAQELAYVLRANRKPFELANILGLKITKRDAKGKPVEYQIVYHRAYTSGDAKSVATNSPVFSKALHDADAQGGVDLIFTTHNHSGSSAQPSQADIDSVAITTHGESRYRVKPLSKKYQGEIITNYNTVGIVPAEKAGKYDAAGQLHGVASSRFKPKDLNFRNREDPILAEGRPLDDRGTEETIGDRQYDWGKREFVFSARDVLNFVRKSVSNQHNLVMVGVGTGMEIRQVMPMDVDAITRASPREVDKLLSTESSSSGVFRWIVVSELDPNSDTYLKLRHLTSRMRQSGDQLYGSMNTWSDKLTAQDDFSKDAGGQPAPLWRIAAEKVDPADRAKAEKILREREKVNDYLLQKFIELGSGNRDARTKQAERAVKEPQESMLQGELAQHEIGPPDITQKPGQGGEGPINVKENLEGLEDSELRREIAASQAALGLDRTKVDSSPESIQNDYADMLSNMSEDDAHNMMKLASTEKGKLVLFEKFMYYRNAVAAESAARADYYQQAETTFDVAAMSKAKEDWVTASILKQAALRDFANAKTNVARLLNFLKTLKTIEVDPNLTRLGAVLSSLKKMGVKKDVLAALRKTYEENPAEFAIALDKAMNPSWFKAFLQLWKAGLVSGPPTRLANIGSNTLFRGILDVTNNTFTPTLDLARSVITGSARERFFGEASASLLAYQQQFGPAMRQWLKDRGGFTLGQVKTIEGGQADIHGEGALQRKLGKITQKVTGSRALGTNIAEFIDIPFKGLNVDDTFAKHLSGAQAAYRYAYRAARKNGQTHHQAMASFPVLAQEIMDGLRDPHSPNYEKHKSVIEEKILPAAKEETFQKEMDGFFSDFENHILKKYPATQLIIPFYRTPVNIIKQTLRFYGIGKFNEMKNRFMDGKMTGEDMEEMGRIAMAGAITSAVGTLVMQGLVTGGGPDDPRKEAELKKTGWLPYSLKIGDTYYNYQRLEPISGVLGIAADMAEAYQSGGLDPRSDKGYKAVQGLMAAIFDNLTSKTFLAGLEGLFTAYHDPKRYGARWVQQNTGSLVPNIVAKTAQVIDPQYRDVSGSWLDPIKARIPGLSKTLPGQTTPSGQPKMRPGGPAARFLSPIASATVDRSPEAQVSKELVNVGYLPSTPKSFYAVGGKQIKLTQQELDAFQNAKNEARSVAARTIKDPSYQALPANEQDPAWKWGMTTRREVLENIYGRYRKPVSTIVNARVRQRALSGAQ